MPRKADPRNLDRVLEAAAELFRDEGYDSATMQQLADRIGIHKSSLYHYVDSKEDLLEKLTTSTLDRADRDLAAAEQSSDHGEAFLSALRLAVIQTIEDIGRVSVVIRQKPGSPTGDAVVERRRSYDRRLAELIAEAQEAGELRDDIHPALIERLTLGMVSWLVEWYSPDLSRFDPDEVTDAVLKLVTDGVRKPEAP